MTQRLHKRRPEPQKHPRVSLFRGSPRGSRTGLITQSSSHSPLATAFGDVCRQVNYIMENVESVHHPNNRKRLIEEVSRDLVSIWRHCQVAPRHSKGVKKKVDRFLKDMRAFNRHSHPTVIIDEHRLFDICQCLCLQKGGHICTCLDEKDDNGAPKKEDPGWTKESMDFYLDQLSERRLTIWKVQYRKMFEIAMTAEGDEDVADEGDIEAPDAEPYGDPMNEDAMSVTDQQ